MKNFILKYIWPIRIIWSAGTVCLFIFVQPKPEYVWLAGILMYANIMILGTFVGFPERFLGKKKLPIETKNDEKNDSVNVNDTDRHKEKWYSFPEPALEDIAIKEKIFTDIQKIRNTCSQIIEDAKKTKQEDLVKVLDPFMMRLKVRVPEHLYEKVDKVFMFTQTDVDLHHKYNLQEIFLERMNAIMGVYILNKLFLTENELQELNQAWHPFIFIHPTMHYIVISKSEAAQARSKKQLEELGFAQKELQV